MNYHICAVGVIDVDVDIKKHFNELTAFNCKYVSSAALSKGGSIIIYANVLGLIIEPNGNKIFISMLKL